MKTPRQRQGGATLIEVLITIIVLSIGLLGFAGMQTVSIQSNQGSYYRSQATLLASDIADRMRANRNAARAGDYALDFPTPSSTNEVTGTRADKDKAEWLNTLNTLLPEGTGRIAISSNILTLSIQWNDNRARIKSAIDSATPSETFVYRTRL